jgi:hypothetical protein
MPGMKRRTALTFALVLATAVFLQAADQFTGTWTLNVAKSKYSPGMPPKSQTTKLETLKDGIREIVDRVNADGKKTHWDFTAKFDGKDYEERGPNVAPDSMSSGKRVNPHTLDVTDKVKGQVMDHTKFEVSPDGKTLTLTIHETGQPKALSIVYDKM